jgi:alkylation response protein AidB-like acyl-CoA dehydrogenase
MVVPTLLEVGEEWQKEMFIEKTVRGQYRWAQGYSEPGSGSDLASLRTKAELVGGEWVINGQKIWTTHAFTATHMFCLCRTEPDAPKHAGISYILFDFKQPGVTVRPIKQISGQQEFCETFLDDVRTPAEWIVGKRGEGWSVSKVNLKHERNAVGSAAGAVGQFDKLVALAKKAMLNGRPAIEEPDIRRRIAVLEGFVQAHLWSGYYQQTLSSRGDAIGALGLMNKINVTNIAQEVARIATDVLGDTVLMSPPADGKNMGDERWLNQIFGSLGISIAGGTSNIQRNVIGERGLHLPRDAGET